MPPMAKGERLVLVDGSWLVYRAFFAIPSNLVKLYVESAVSGRKLERPWLGAKLDNVNRDLAEALNLDRVAGALVSSVSSKGPAAAAGLDAAMSAWDESHRYNDWLSCGTLGRRERVTHDTQALGGGGGCGGR